MAVIKFFQLQNITIITHKEAKSPLTTGKTNAEKKFSSKVPNWTIIPSSGLDECACQAHFHPETVSRPFFPQSTHILIFIADIANKFAFRRMCGIDIYKVQL